LIMLFSAISAASFMGIIVRKYYKISIKSIIKILLFSSPLMLFFGLDMNVLFKILGAAVSSIFYLFLVWKKFLDEGDRELFNKFYIKIKAIIFP